MTDKKEEDKGGDFTERLDKLESKLDRLVDLMSNQIERDIVNGEAEKKNTVGAEPKKKRGRPPKNSPPKESGTKKRGRPKKEASHPNNPSQTQIEDEILIDEQTPGSDTSGKRILLSENDQISKPTRMGRGTREPRNNSAKGKGRTSNPSGRPQKNFGQISSVRLSGQNNFLKMSEFKAAKADAKIDKLLWGQNERTPRPEPFEPIEVQCGECNRYFSVNPRLVFHDPDEGLIFTCNGCSSGYRGGN